MFLGAGDGIMTSATLSDDDLSPLVINTERKMTSFWTVID